MIWVLLLQVLCTIISIPQQQKLLDKLRAAGVVVEEVVAPAAQGDMAGKLFVITRTFPVGREQFRQL